MGVQVQHALSGCQTDAHQLVPVEVCTGAVQQLIQRPPVLNVTMYTHLAETAVHT